MYRLRPNQRQAGSTLGTTLVLSAVMTVLIAAYLILLTHDSRMVNRSGYYDAAMHVAEAGVEEAFAQLSYGNEAWTSNGWTKLNGANVPDYTKTVTNLFSVNGQVVAGRYTVCVWSNGLQNVNPYIISTGIVHAVATGFGSNSNIVRTVRVGLRKVGLFRWGLVSKTSVDCNGNNVTIDSFDSSDPNYSNFNFGLGYGVYTNAPGKWKDNGDIYALSNAVNNIGNSDIYGNFFTRPGGTITCGPGGFLAGIGQATNGVIDTRRVFTNVVLSVDNATLPADFRSIANLGSISSSISFNGGGSGPVDYTVSGISLSGPRTLTFNSGYTRLYVTGNISINASVIVQPAARAEIYVNGSTSIGAVVNNAQQASSLLIFSLSNNAVTLNGGSACTLAIYAPNSAVSISGGGYFAGGIVANSIRLNGNVAVHFDEALKETPTRWYYLNSWQEL